MDDLEIRKKHLLVNVIKFLQEDIVKSNFNDERKESIEVAVQCLETAYEIDDIIKQKVENEGKVDLLSFIKAPERQTVVSEEAQAEAVECKNRGNTAMKNNDYNLAVEEYTKAIQLNPLNAVYFCNRAAAYSRLDKHHEAINDCKEAIKLDPTYGKAYGRLGIAYCNLNMFEQARSAYHTALIYDPTNTMYETNLKLAEERLFSAAEGTAPRGPLDISQFINNPALINMATQMLSDPSFRNMMSNIMQMNNSGDPDLDALFQAGQTLASRMNTADPNFVESFRRAVNEQGAPNENNSTDPTPQKKPDA